MYCCANCFGDEYLSDKINKTNSNTGRCDYCKTEDIPIIEVRELTNEFEFLLSIYKEAPARSAKSIAECLVDDWDLCKKLDRLTCVQLIGDIVGDTTLASKCFVPETLKITPKEKWIKFCKELVSQYRFFPNHQPDQKYLPILFGYLKENVSEPIYRARIQNGSTLHKKTEMGMPPPEKTRGGRANPVGIPYFYGASNVETAIAEVRPHPGNNVTVCKFKIRQDLNVLNLINPREIISPFRVAYLQEDYEYMLQLRYDVEFLCHLGAELSKPITPDSAELDYLPTQYLCEMIKKADFDGVKFISSVGNGVNITLFNENKVNAASVSSHYIKNLKYDY